MSAPPMNMGVMVFLLNHTACTPYINVHHKCMYTVYENRYGDTLAKSYCMCTVYCMKIGMVIPLLSHFACAPYKCVDLASPSCFTCRSCEGWQHQCPCSRVLSCYLGLAITVYMHCIDRIFGNFPANKTVCTPYIYGSGRPYCYACVYMCAHTYICFVHTDTRVCIYVCSHTHTHTHVCFIHACVKCYCPFFAES
jgi:hypothetical protein